MSIFDPVFNINEQDVRYKVKDKQELVEIILERNAKPGVPIDLNDINVSKITDMSYLFSNVNCKGLNFDVSEWDVSNVTNMSGMFAGCGAFTGNDLGNWDVRKVTNMRCMFAGCDGFDGSGLDNWKVNPGTDTENMFLGCRYVNPKWYKGN